MNEGWMERILADSNLPSMIEEDDDVAAKTTVEVPSKEFLRRILEDKKILTRPHVAPGKDGKRRTVVRLYKQDVEIRRSLPRPEPYPRMSDGHIDRLEALMRCPGQIRVEEDEMAAYGQRRIDRDPEMRRQYALHGYADLEFTDDDEDEEYDLEESARIWKSWAAFKASGGLLDG